MFFPHGILISFLGSVEADLDPGLYLIIPCTFTPGKVGAFELRAICYDNVTVPPLVPLKDVKFLSIKVKFDSKGTNSFRAHGVEILPVARSMMK